MTESSWSVPETDVLARTREALDTGERAVLATVVDVEGNAYRRPGAKMLLSPDSTDVGSVTAGCLEDDLRRLAEDVLAAGEPRTETYDLMDGDDDVWGLGVGCNGIIDVLLEPLTEDLRPVLEAEAAAEPIGTVIVFDGDASPWARAVYRPDEGFTDDSDEVPEWLLEAVAEKTAALVERDAAEVIKIDTPNGSAKVFVDGFSPPPKLVVIGSGHDIGPVVELAKNVDFRVHVVGYRGATTTKERFPAADAVRATSPARLLNVESFTKHTHVVVMTHNFVDDRLTVKALLETPVSYIGLMGPEDRFEEILEALHEDDAAASPNAADFERIYTPVGLDLGSGTPYQIAHSIVAELLAVTNDRDPTHLRNRNGPIHDRLSIT